MRRGIEPGARVGMVGIGGSGMQGLALLLYARGISVTGSDDSGAAVPLADIEYVDTETLAGRAMQFDAVILSDAVPNTHPVRRAAAQAGVACWSYAQALGELSRAYTTLAVAGTHGKSSTTALLGHILTVAGLDPTVLVGAAVPAWGNRHARVGDSQYLVVEADEYMNHFLELTPAAAIITSIDYDHPDFFASRKAVGQSFEQFVRRVPDGGQVFVLERVVAATRDVLAWPATVRPQPVPLEPLALMLPGQHMQENAGLALAMAESLGVPREEAAAAAEAFTGLARRFEKIGVAAHGLTIYSDYGHHPAEVAATLAAARERLAEETLVVLFEPHTWSRVLTFGPAFAQAFIEANVPVILCPVFGAREEVSEEAAEAYAALGQALAAAGLLQARLGSYDELPEVVAATGRDFTAALAFSAGILDHHLRGLVIA